MEPLPPPDSRPTPIVTAPGREARGLFAAGWYATRDEGRLVHPADQIEQTVSLETWRSLRELGMAAGIRPSTTAAS